MVTNDFDEFAAYLEVPRADDEWYDHSIDQAEEQLAGFSHDDWQALRLAWASRTPRWQRRCAECLGGGDLAHSVPLLFAMLGADAIVAAEAAAFTLASIPEARLHGVVVGADPTAGLDAVRRRTARPAVIEAVEGFQRRWRTLHP